MFKIYIYIAKFSEFYVIVYISFKMFHHCAFHNLLFWNTCTELHNMLLKILLYLSIKAYAFCFSHSKKGLLIIMFPFPLFFKQYATLSTWDFHGVCMYMYLYHVFILKCTWIITPFTLLVCTLLKAIQTCLFLVIQKKNNWICSWCWRFWKKWKIIFFWEDICKYKDRGHNYYFISDIYKYEIQIFRFWMRSKLSWLHRAELCLCIIFF